MVPFLKGIKYAHASISERISYILKIARASTSLENEIRSRQFSESAMEKNSQQLERYVETRPRRTMGVPAGYIIY